MVQYLLQQVANINFVSIDSLLEDNKRTALAAADKKIVKQLLIKHVASLTTRGLTVN